MYNQDRAQTDSKIYIIILIYLFIYHLLYSVHSHLLSDVYLHNYFLRLTSISQVMCQMAQETLLQRWTHIERKRLIFFW